METTALLLARMVAAAAERLRDQANLTPVATSRTLDHLVNASVFCKCENFQRTGSFKFRGAYNALSQHNDAAGGVLAFSSGNHAQALALAGKLLNVPVTIVMPQNAPAIKRAATEGYGATVIPYNPSETVREALAQKLSEERQLPIIPPYDHPHIMAGQGTSALEILEQCPDLDVIITPVGGGGLLSGTAVVAKDHNPNIQVIGAEPEQANDAALSFRSGTLQTLHNPDTIADGARTPHLGRYTFPVIRELTDDIVTVSETAIIHAMHFLWARMKLIIEPTGALGIAALLSGAYRATGARIGVILSGGNTDLQTAHQLFNRLKQARSTARS